MKHFFVSYTTADEAWAKWIAWHLESAGYSTVIQAWDFRPGSNFVLEMQRALAECERVIAVLSPRYLASKFAAEEWSAAIASDPTSDRLLPIRIEPCDNEGLLRARIYIDLVGTDEATAKQRLLDGVKRGRAKPTTAPPFPQKSGVPAPRFPGTLPAIWNVPFLRNPHFTGRDDLLTQLHTAPHGAIALTQPQAIHGLGGVGKTQLAVEYAYRYASEYDLVWWIRADSLTLIATDLALLAAPLQLPERDERDQNVVVRAVLHALAQRNRWLLIFDNAEEPRDVRPFLPQGAGRVLITSRNPAWGALAQPLEVQTLPRDQAIEFLLRRVGVIASADVIASREAKPCPESSRRESPTRESEIASARPFDSAALRSGSLFAMTRDAGDLADALGCLPLALEQAGAYIEANGITLGEYLRLYRAHQRELLAHPPATDYPASVATTWEISFNAIAAQGRNGIASLQLLNLLAFFAPEPIPREILQTQRVAEMLGVAVDDDYAFNAVIAPLRRYSLVQTGEGTLTVHRLVQAVVRDRRPMTEDGRPTTEDKGQEAGGGRQEAVGGRQSAVGGRQEAEVALHCVNDAFPFDVQNDVSAWATCARLYVHARVVTDEAERMKIAPEATARLLNQVALYLQQRAELTRAKECFERVVKIFEDNSLQKHPNYASAINNLGFVLHALGDLPHAKECYERALAIDEAAFGPHHPKVAIRVNNLGSVLQDLGDLPRAKECFERALAIDEAAFGPNHPNVAIHVNNLGNVLRALGDLPRAKECCERALTIDEAVFGPHHPNVARDVNNLGGFLYALGNLNGARECFERAYSIYRNALGEDHPTTMLIRSNLQVLIMLQKLPRPIRFLLNRLERMIPAQRQSKLQNRMQQMIRTQRERQLAQQSPHRHSQ